MRFSGWAAVAVLMTGSLAGCTFGDQQEAEPAPVEALDPPENLCDLVPVAVVERWRLAEDAHRRSDSDQHSKWARCAMTGVDGQGEPVLLSAGISTYGDLGKPGPERMSDAVREVCDDLRLSSEGSFSSDEGGCTVVSPADPATRMAGTTIFRPAEAAAGKVQVQVSQRDEVEPDLVSDVEAVADALVGYSRG